jgi:hypothetical protein
MPDLVKEVKAFQKVLYSPDEAIEDCRSGILDAHVNYGGLWQSDQLTQMRLLAKWIQASRFVIAGSFASSALEDDSGKKRKNIPPNITGLLSLSNANYVVWQQWNDYQDRLRSALEIDIDGNEVGVTMDHASIVGSFNRDTIGAYRNAARLVMVSFFDLVRGIDDEDFKILSDNREFLQARKDFAKNIKDTVNRSSRIDKTAVDSIDPNSQAGIDMYQDYFDLIERFVVLGACALMPGSQNSEMLIKRTKPPIKTNLAEYRVTRDIAAPARPAPASASNLPTYDPSRPEPKLSEYDPDAESRPAPASASNLPTYDPSRPEPKLSEYDPDAESRPAPASASNLPTYDPSRPEPKLSEYDPDAESLDSTSVPTLPEYDTKITD